MDTFNLNHPIIHFTQLKRPDRWDNLPESASALPGLFSNTLTFSSGPRVWKLVMLYVLDLCFLMQSCIGMRFSLIEIKIFLYILVTNFAFQTTEDKIIRSNA